MNPKNHVLYSGAAQGSESEFGKLAEKLGVQEVNFTFNGHIIYRTRGVRVLTSEELLKGDVSLAYLSKLMNRKYNTGSMFKKVLQSIWHQINSAEEVFVVGTILDDKTVKEGQDGEQNTQKYATKPYMFTIRSSMRGLNGSRETGKMRIGPRLKAKNLQEPAHDF